MNASQTGGDAAYHASPSPPNKSARPGSRRRRWLLATALILFCAAAGATALWTYQGSKYTAVAIIRVRSREPRFLFQTSHQTEEDDFETYKNTQQMLLRSRFVLTAALRPQIETELDILRNDPKKRAKLDILLKEDPVSWLAEELKVNSSAKSEIIEVSLTGYNKDEVTAIVNAVVDAYMKEVVDLERKERNIRLTELRDLHQEKDAELRKKRTVKNSLANDLGLDNGAALSLKQQIILEQLAALRKEHTRVRFDLRRAKSQLRMQKAQLDLGDVSAFGVPLALGRGNGSGVLPGLGTLHALGQSDIKGRYISEIELNAAAQSDPVAGRLLFELLFKCSQRLDKQLGLMRAVALTPSESQQLEELAQAIEATQQQLDLRRATLREELQQAGRNAAVVEVKRLQCQIALLEDQERQLSRDVDREMLNVEQIGRPSTDAEMIRDEIECLEEIVNHIAIEREKLVIELNSRPRVTRLGRLVAPEKPSPMFAFP